MPPDRAPGRVTAGVLLPTLLVVGACLVRHPKVIYTSDSVAQQSIVRTWLDVGHGQAHVPADTWALKVPLYLLLELLPLDPGQRLPAAVVVLNAVTFVLLGLAVLRLAPAARWYELAFPLGFLAVLGGGIGANRMLPNYRNVELGLSFLLLAEIFRCLTGPSRTVGRVRAGLALPALAVFWFDDPYFALLVAGPLAVAALAWFVLRQRDLRLLLVAALLTASVALLPLLQAAVGLAGIRIDHTEQLSPGLGQLRRGLGTMVSDSGLQLGLTRLGGNPTAATVAGVATALAYLLMLGLSAWLAVNGWRTRELVPWFIGAHWPLAIVGTLLQADHPTRYLVLSVYDLVIASVIALPRLRLQAGAGRWRGQPGRQPVLVAGFAAAAFGAGSLPGSAAFHFGEPPSAGQVKQQALVRTVRATGVTKGFAPYWSANITSYLAGPSTTVYELACGDGALLTRSWLSDTARLTRPATRTFVIWDPAYYSLRGCTPAARDRELGPPAGIYPVTGGVQVLVYRGDLARTLGTSNGPQGAGGLRHAGRA